MTDKITQQADALAMEIADAIFASNPHNPASCAAVIKKVGHLSERMALEEAVRKDHGGKNFRAHCKICHALAAIDEARKESK